MWGHISSTAAPQPTLLGCFLVSVSSPIGPSTSVWIFPQRGHGIFERTPGSKMLAITDPTFDLLIFKLLFDAIFLGLFVLAIFLPSHARPENDVLSNARRVERRSRRMALFAAELGPSAPLSHAGIDGLFNDGGADATSCFDLFAIVVEAV